MRVAFSIIHNGLHHLHHNLQYKKILDCCDKWVVVEGASMSNGSTNWCNSFPESFHVNGGSNDGTREFLSQLSSESDKLVYIKSNGFWNSKDYQVNRAIEEVKKITHSCWLWEIDIDEQWECDQMDQAELELLSSGCKAACFKAKCFIGKNLRAIGDWGEACTYGYTRLWKWEGEEFVCHEPPILNGLMGVDPVMLTPVFKHFNYYFEKDVVFKDKWYGGHEGIYERWKLINSLDRKFFPMHISNLIIGPWGNSNSAIIYDDSSSIRKIVQIGSNNGRDHVFEKLKVGKFQCIFVEPNPYSVIELKKTYSHLENSIFENSAISTFDGEIDMYFNDMESGDSSHSSISLSHVLDHNNPKENITHKKVKCLMLETLLKKHSWDSDEIEWLYIDAEGHDCDIILSTDFSKLRIKNIFFETVHSDGSFKKGEKLERTFNWLYSHGYLKNARETIDNSNIAFSRP